MPWEMNFLNWINEYCHDWAWLTLVLRYITALGDGGFIWFVVGIAFLFSKKTRAMGLTVLAGVIFIAGFNVFIFKPLVHRIRPYNAVGGEALQAFALATFTPLITIGNLKLFGMTSGYSFVSGHTLSSVISATILWKFDRRWGIPAMILAVLIALSRLYFGLHYPTDVIAGAVVGVAAGFLCYSVAKKIEKSIRKKKLAKQAPAP